MLLQSTPVPAGSGTVRRVAPNAATPQGRAVDRRAAKRVILAWPRQRNTRQRPADVALNNHVDLRRAIVVIAILERCRAINPYDSPERSARE